MLRPGGYLIQAISLWVRLDNVRLAYWHLVALFLIASICCHQKAWIWLVNVFKELSMPGAFSEIRDNPCKSWIAWWYAARTEVRQEGNFISSLKHPQPLSRALTWPSAAGPAHPSLMAASPQTSWADELWHRVPEGTIVAAETWLVNRDQSKCLFVSCPLFLPSCHHFPAMTPSLDVWKCCGCIQERLVTMGAFSYL